MLFVIVVSRMLPISVLPVPVMVPTLGSDTRLDYTTCPAEAGALSYMADVACLCRVSPAIDAVLPRSWPPMLTRLRMLMMRVGRCNRLRFTFMLVAMVVGLVRSMDRVAAVMVSRLLWMAEMVRLVRALVTLRTLPERRLLLCVIAVLILVLLVLYTSSTITARWMLLVTVRRKWVISVVLGLFAGSIMLLTRASLYTGWLCLRGCECRSERQLVSLAMSLGLGRALWCRRWLTLKPGLGL